MYDRIKRLGRDKRVFILEKNELLYKVNDMAKKKFIAKDRHKLDSEYEKRVDDCLYEKGIMHTIHEKVPGSGYICDFKVCDVFVEIWGVETREYLIEKKKKKQFYNKKGLKLVNFEKKDLDRKWKIRKKIEEIEEKKKCDQGDMDIWNKAEERARKCGELDEVEKKLKSIKKEKKEMEKELEELKKKIESLKGKKKKIIMKHVHLIQ